MLTADNTHRAYRFAAGYATVGSKCAVAGQTGEHRFAILAV